MRITVAALRGLGRDLPSVVELRGDLDQPLLAAAPAEGAGSSPGRPHRAAHGATLTTISTSTGASSGAPAHRPPTARARRRRRTCRAARTHRWPPLAGR